LLSTEGEEKGKDNPKLAEAVSEVKKPRAVSQFYRRPLPSLNGAVVAFSSDVGRERFRSALCGGWMGCFFPLIEQFRTQDEPAYCGVSTLTMILNALQVDPGRSI